MGSKAHLLDRMMDFVKAPKPVHAVEQSMDVPMHEITNDEHDQQLQPGWRAMLQVLQGQQVRWNAWQPGESGTLHRNVERALLQSELE